MEDRELLELAAKAAGIGGKYVEYVSCNGIDQSGTIPCPYTAMHVGQYANTTFHVIKCWNPLTDDGDALRLAVRLGLRVDFADCGMTCVDEYEAWEPHGNDQYAATRRAIVRAAAEVGKGMLTHDEFVLMFPDRFEDEEVQRAAAEIGKAMP